MIHTFILSPPPPPPPQVEVDMAGVPVYSNSSKPGPTHLPHPLCRKCGSGGLMELIRCRVCCHPFHRFCAGEQKSSSIPFTCPQCITCSICGLGNNVSLKIKGVNYNSPLRSFELKWQSMWPWKQCKSRED